MHFKVEKTGCTERKGMVQIRYCLYLDPKDYGYDKQYVEVKDMTEERIAIGQQYQDEYLLWESQFDYILKQIDKKTLAIVDTRTLPADTDEPELQLAFLLFSESDNLKYSYSVTRDIGDEIFPKQKKWDDWLAAIPMIWQLNPFHNHFVQVEPGVTNEEIKYVGELALQMAKEKWDKDEFPNVKNQFVSYPKIVTAERKLACEIKVEAVKDAEIQTVQAVK